MKLVEEALGRVDGDIALNRAVSGVDFSIFLGTVLHIINNYVFTARIKARGLSASWEYMDKEKEITDIKDMCMRFILVQFQVIEVQNFLEIEIKKIVDFHETTKAITAIGRISCGKSDQESEVLEKYATELRYSHRDYEINRRAVQRFYSGLLSR